jgi:aryl-alcohol dehydrogenase-like predicted oxidoreductase
MVGTQSLPIYSISDGAIFRITYGDHVNDDVAFECMKTAYDAGINFFDCAEGYGNGKSEVTIGKAIKKFGWKRNDIVISTKIYWGLYIKINITKLLINLKIIF